VLGGPRRNESKKEGRTSGGKKHRRDNADLEPDLRRTYLTPGPSQVHPKGPGGKVGRVKKKNTQMGKVTKHFSGEQKEATDQGGWNQILGGFVR